MKLNRPDGTFLAAGREVAAPAILTIDRAYAQTRRSRSAMSARDRAAGRFCRGG